MFIVVEHFIGTVVVVDKLVSDKIVVVEPAVNTGWMQQL